MPPADTAEIAIDYVGNGGLVFRDVCVRNIDSGEEITKTVALIHGGGDGLSIENRGSKAYHFSRCR